MDNFTVVFGPSMEGYSWETVDLDWWKLRVAEILFKFIPTISLLYLSGIYFGQKFMKNRKSFGLNRSLVVWNGILAIFSTICAYKGYLEIFHGLEYYGLYPTFCKRLPYSKPCGFWSVAFLFSKLFELGDTAFLVLKKKKIIFLHWFHHFAIFNTAFYIFPKFEPAVMAGGTMNAGVHSVMYTYFALMAAGLKIPKKFAMAITSIQIIQFIIGLSIIYYAVYNKVYGEGCLLSNETITCGAAQISMYFVLFSKIFYDNYKSLKTNKTKVE